MEDYPRNLAEFEARFASEQACREYLCQLRWPEGFRCPRCGHDKTWAVRTVLLQCASCGHQASATVLPHDRGEDEFQYPEFTETGATQHYGGSSRISRA